MSHTWELSWGSSFSRKPLLAPDTGVDALAVSSPSSLTALPSKDSLPDPACKLPVRGFYLFPCCTTWAWHSARNYAKCSISISSVNEWTTSLYPSGSLLTEEFACSEAKAKKIISVCGAIAIWVVGYRDTWVYKYILCRKNLLLGSKIQQWYLE